MRPPRARGLPRLPNQGPIADEDYTHRVYHGKRLSTTPDSRLTASYERPSVRTPEGPPRVFPRERAWRVRRVVRDVPRTGTERFPKTARLLKRAEFVQLSRRGFRVQSANFIIISSANQRPQSRLGITVSAKVGNSVVRNRIKRQVRECFRRRRSALPLPEPATAPVRPSVARDRPRACRSSLVRPGSRPESQPPARLQRRRSPGTSRREFRSGSGCHDRWYVRRE